MSTRGRALSNHYALEEHPRLIIHDSLCVFLRCKDSLQCQNMMRGYLEGEHSAGLESQVSLEVLSNLTHEPLEGQLADEQLSGLLVLANLTQGDSSWPVPVCICFLSALNCQAVPNG